MNRSGNLNKKTRFLLYLLIILQTNFFSLEPSWGWIIKINSYTSKYLSLIVMILIFILNFKSVESIYHTAYNQFKIPILTLVFFNFILGILTIFKYKQGVFSTFTASYYFYVLIFYFFLITLISQKGEIQKLLIFVVRTGLIYSLMLIIQDVFLKFKIQFLNLDSSSLLVEYGAIFHGFYRIKAPSDFISFSILLVIILAVLSKKFTLTDFITLCVDFFYLIFVSQTRTYIITDLVIIGVWLLMKLNRVHRFFTIVSLYLVGLVGSFSLSDLLLKFSTGSRKESLSVRIEAIKFYFNEVPRWSMFGIGFPNTAATDYILHGGFLVIYGYQYYLDDIGILGFLTVFGLSGLLIIVMFFYKIIKGFWYSKNKWPLLILILYLSITSISVSLFNVQRIILLPVLLLLITYFSITKEKY